MEITAFGIFCEHWLKPTLEIRRKQFQRKEYACILEKAIINSYACYEEGTCNQALSNLENDFYYLEEMDINPIDYTFRLIEFLMDSLMIEPSIVTNTITPWTLRSRMYERLIKKPLYSKNSIWFKNFNYLPINENCLRRVDAIIALF
jgi:hypothetical protein